jgi:hypothetical protein
LSFLLPSGVLRAGRGDKAGTAAAPELLIPWGARGIALGGAPIALVSGIEAIYWNPAGLARLRAGAGVTFSHMSYLGDIGVDCFAAGAHMGELGSVALSVRSLSFGQIPVTTEDMPDGTGETTSPTYLTVGATLGREISDRISVGITANVIYEKMARVSATGVAFSMGVQYSGIGGIEGLAVGAAVKNIGPSFKFDGTGLLRSAQVTDATLNGSTLKIPAASSDLPSTIEIGLGYTLRVSETGQLNIMSAFQNNNYSDDEYRFGAEYSFTQNISFQGGYAFASQTEGREYIYGPSAGVRLHTTLASIDFTIDYAYRAVKYFSGNHIITLTMEF